MGTITQKYGFSNADRYRFVYELESHPNIISRPSMKNHDEHVIAHTMAMEYRYALEEDKQQLGYDAICFKQLYGERKDNFISRIKQHKTNVPMLDILFVLNNLLSFGIDKKWARLTLAKVLDETGLPIQNYIVAIDYLYDSKIVVLKNVMRSKGGVSFACHIASTENSFKMLDFLTLKYTQMETNPVKVESRRIVEKPKPKPIKQKIDYEKMVVQLNSENLDLKDANKELESSLEKSKEIEEKLLQYNDDYKGFCLDQLFLFLGKTQNLLVNFEKTHPESKQLTNQLKKEMLELGQDFSQELANYH
jgi:hypothetical protein